MKSESCLQLWNHEETADRLGPMRSMPAPAPGTVGPWFQTHDQEQIDYFEGSIRTANCNGSPGRRLGQKFGVFDRQRSTVGKMDVKWLKRPSHVHLS